MTREDAIANLKMIKYLYVEPASKEQAILIDDTFDMAIKALSEEPKPGWWIWINDGEYRCSICRELTSGESNYCPNCGSKLTGRIVI